MDSDAITLPTARTTQLDPPPDLAQIRASEPLRALRYPDGHVGWLVTGHELARKILGDPRFSARMELLRPALEWPALDELYGHPAPPGMFIHMDAPEHTKYRRALAGPFTRRQLEKIRPRIEAIIEEHLDEMETEGPSADLVESFALPIPSLVICEILGMPYADHPEFHRLNEVVTSRESTVAEGTAAWNAIVAYFDGLVREKRSHPANDLLSDLVRAGLGDDEISGIGLLLHRAGHETTANMISLGVFTLLCDPEQHSKLLAEADLFDNAIEELLRYLSILQFGIIRVAKEELEIGGKTIKEGACVTISLPAVNRDPNKFAQPDKFDVTRETSGHLAFAFGVHQCLGQNLARIEMKAAYQALFRRFPLLHLAVPAEDVEMCHDMGFYGVRRLPVAW